MTRHWDLSHPRVVLLLAMLSCFLWGSATPSIKTGYVLFQIASSDTSSIILFAGIRFLLAGLLVILTQSLLRRRFLRPQLRALPEIFTLSLAQTAVQYLFFYVGLAHASGVRSTILSGTGGLIAILMAGLIVRSEPLTRRKLLGCLVGFSGILVMNLSGAGGGSLLDMTLLGEGFVLLSQVCYGLSSVLIQRFSARFDVVMLSGWQFTLGGATMIAVGAISGGRVRLPAQGGAYVLLLYLGLISAVAYSVWGILLQHNPVSRVTIYSFLTPVFGVLLSALFLGEWAQALSPKTLAALILVCAGIYTVNREAP